MQQIRFGRTGLKISRLCLGTMTFGLQCDETTSRAILDAAAEGGIIFLDTADVYPFGGTLEQKGRTEEIIGRWLRGKRGQLAGGSSAANLPQTQRKFLLPTPHFCPVRTVRTTWVPLPRTAS